MNKEVFGKFISETRRDLGMTQQALASKLHVTDKAVSKWERGLSYPDVTLLEDLAAALDMSVSDLIACRKCSCEELYFDQSEQVCSLLDIAGESQRNLKKKVWFGIAIIGIAIVIAVLSLFLYRTRTESFTGYTAIWGKQEAPEGNLVYIERDNRLITLVCEDQAMFDGIYANDFYAHHVAYSWKPFSNTGTLESCKFAPEASVSHSAMDMAGSCTDAGSLFGIDCMWVEYRYLFPDPARQGEYLYSLSFFYRNDGKDYYTHKQDAKETEVLRIKDVRRFTVGDFDEDGMGELFVLTQYKEAPFKIYDMENGEIVCRFVEEAPPMVQELLDLDALLS